MIPTIEKEVAIIEALSEYLQDHEREPHAKIIDRLMYEHIIDLPTAEKFLEKALFRNSLGGQYYFLLSPEERKKAESLGMNYMEYFRIHRKWWSSKQYLR